MLRNVGDLPRPKKDEKALHNLINNTLRNQLEKHPHKPLSTKDAVK